jgi:proline iminopeptidase
MITTLTAGAVAALSAPIAGALVHRSVRRRRAARALAIDTPNGIVDARFVPIGGIEQWIGVRGEDRGNPVLLELHGGPGASNTIFAPRTRAWERHFTLVRWDMRGAGKTFGRGGERGQGALTIEQVLADAVEVTEYARGLLGKRRVVLVANSFGSIFGLHLARRRPDLYAAYVGTDQNITRPGGEAQAYTAVLARLRAAGRRRDLAVIEAMGPDTQRWTARDWSTGARITAQSDPRVAHVVRRLLAPSLWFSPLHRLPELRHFTAGMAFSARLFLEAARADAWREGTRFELPFFVFQGEHDTLTPVDTARRYFADVQAPVKEMALIRDAAHFASFWRPEQFLELLLTRVRPHLAERA